MFYFFLFFFWLVTSILNSASAGTTPQQRCTTRDCMCTVTNDVPLTHKEADQLIEVFFPEDGAEVAPDDRARLGRWRGGPATVVATTDGCGGAKYNLLLATKRANAVAAALGEQYVQRLVPVGKTTATHGDRYRRVLVVSSHDWMAGELAKKPADYYLLDASGSAERFWGAIQSFRYPTGAELYVAKTDGCRNGMDLADVVPGGKTELWYPLYLLLEQAKYGTTILYVSDMNSTVPLSSGDAERIRQLADEKGVTLQYIKY